MVTVAIGLSFLTIWFDQTSESNIIEKFWWTYTLGQNGSRAILSAVAGSMISVATTAFSITIVALQLASSQFGPRLLRNFMRDTGNQIVLGTFISTFIYCLLVLRTINGTEENEFVPTISVTCGIMLALASIGVLIYFIHHAAASIQVDNVITKVGCDIDDTIERLFPKKVGRGASAHALRRIEEDIPADFDRDACPIKGASGGYIQSIDDDELMQIALENNLVLRVQHRPGNFVVQGSDLVLVWPGEHVNKKLGRKINDAFILGSKRTELQDVEFCFNQLVEIAARALSPGINDPFTAIRCIDQLSAALSHFAQKDIPSPYRYDRDDKLRVIAEPVTFADMTNVAFNKIRQYGQSSVGVTIRLLEAIAVIAPYTHNNKYRAALLRHAHTIERGSHEGVSEELDRKDVEERYQVAVKLLQQQSTP